MSVSTAQPPAPRRIPPNRSVLSVVGYEQQARAEKLTIGTVRRPRNYLAMLRLYAVPTAADSCAMQAVS